MAFRGTFDHTLDAKNRLTVPSKFRARLSGGLVIAKGVERCVALWTPSEYDAFVSAALESLNPLSPQARNLQRYFSANAVETELDSAGRVMVPGFLLEHGDLQKDVVVTGAGPCLEIWDRGVWARENERLAAEVLDITATLGQSG
jgi:MraZ protein